MIQIKLNISTSPTSLHREEKTPLYLDGEDTVVTFGLSYPGSDSNPRLGSSPDFWELYLGSSASA